MTYTSALDIDSIHEEIIQANGLELKLHLFANKWRAADKSKKPEVDMEVRDYLSRQKLTPSAISSSYFFYYESKK